jgi:hypothetical protein
MKKLMWVAFTCFLLLFNDGLIVEHQTKLRHWVLGCTTIDSLNIKSDTIWWQADSVGQPFGELEGVTMFRGNPARTYFGEGPVPRRQEEVALLWTYSDIGGMDHWKGIGWTGQPLVVRWQDSLKSRMNWNDAFRETGGPVYEVLVAALDGCVHFVDLETGKATRDPLRAAPLPIKGTITVDPRGYPLLYVGQGLPFIDDKNGKRIGAKCGYRIYSLINFELLLFINGFDFEPYRKWPAFDSNGIVIPEKDALLLGGENGIFYRVMLNTRLKEDGIHITPTILTYKQKKSYLPKQGIEGSVAVWRDNVYWADNEGKLTGLDLNSFSPIFKPVDLGDDTDATITIEESDGVPYLYVGSEVDWQGSPGTLRFYKINGLDGTVQWIFESKAKSIIGKSRMHALNGGILSSAALGHGPFADLVYITTAMELIDGKMTGRVIALEKKSGKVRWWKKLHSYTWSSPILITQLEEVKDEKDIDDSVEKRKKVGEFYSAKQQRLITKQDSSAAGQEQVIRRVVVGTIIAADEAGNVSAFDAGTGASLWSIDLNAVIESSPIAWKGRILIGTRDGRLVCLGYKNLVSPNIKGVGIK